MFKWYDYLSIYWHSKLLHTGIMMWMHGSWSGLPIVISTWWTWRVYEECRRKSIL